MKKNTTIFLQILTILIAIGVLAFMFWEPQIEGRNMHAGLFDIYFKDAFLACTYLASIPFFVALYQTFKILGYVRKNMMSSQATVKALRTIKYCAELILIFVLAAEAFLVIARPGDDIAGGVFMGLLVIVISGAIAITATRFGKVLQNRK